MIAAFGMAIEGIPVEVEREREDGVFVIEDSAVVGVHLTRLLPDGSDRERGEHAKIMVGMSAGFPIILAPPTDLLGIGLAEGIENGLTLHEATGLGVWVAGSASRLPALADVIPNYIECVTISVDDDPDGRRYSEILADRVQARGIDVRWMIANKWRAAA